MKNQNLSYIKANYLTLEELAERTGVDASAILGLIEKEIIPKASYSIQETTGITSPLGDSVEYVTTTDYYPKSSVELILDRARLRDRVELKEQFRATFKQQLENHPDRAFAYGNIFDAAGELLEKAFEQAFEEEWQAYIAGIYGICTLNATAEEIVKKEIVVKKLIAFKNQFGDSHVGEQEQQELKALQEEFDAVANLFAPYQRASSSRGKYLDLLLAVNGLAERIKPYKEQEAVEPIAL